MRVWVGVLHSFKKKMFSFVLFFIYWTNCSLFFIFKHSIIPLILSFQPIFFILYIFLGTICTFFLYSVYRIEILINNGNHKTNNTWYTFYSNIVRLIFWHFYLKSYTEETINTKMTRGLLFSSASDIIFLYLFQLDKIL